MATESKEAPTHPSGQSQKGSPVRWAWIGLSLLGLLLPLGWLLMTRTRSSPAMAPSSPTMAMGGRPTVRLDSLSEGSTRFPDPQADAPSKAIALAPPPAPAQAAPSESDAVVQPKPAPEKKPQGGGGSTRKRESASPESAKTTVSTKDVRADRPARPAKPVPTRPQREEGHGVDAAAPAPPAAETAPPAPAPAPSAMVAPPGGPSARPQKTNDAPKPPSKPTPVSRSGKSSRAVSVAGEDMDAPAEELARAPAAERTVQKKQVVTEGNSAAEGIGLGRLGTIGHGGGSAMVGGVPTGTSNRASPGNRETAAKKTGTKRGKSKKGGSAPTQAPQKVTEEAEAAEGGEDADVASLKPGWFGTKIPSPMNLHQATNVYVTVTREENKVKGRAKLEAMPSAATPAKIQEDEILVGKFLRVELRALQSEFEIQAISSSEQRLIPGKVTTWQWKVVPMQPGPRELSVVVTNLTDVRGQPIDLTVHSVTVEVEADTMHKLKSVGSLFSSAMGGLMSLFGMYKGIVGPLLARRREKDGGKDKDKDKGSGGGKDKGPPSPNSEGQPATPADDAKSSAPPTAPTS